MFILLSTTNNQQPKLKPPNMLMLQLLLLKPPSMFMLLLLLLKCGTIANCTQHATTMQKPKSKTAQNVDVAPVVMRRHRHSHTTCNNQQLNSKPRSMLVLLLLKCNVLATRQSHTTCNQQPKLKPQQNVDVAMVVVEMRRHRHSHTPCNNQTN
jgi:hypothetical protein